MPKKKADPTPEVPQEKPRTRIPQSDVPRNSITEALRVPRALFEHLAGGPATPLQVAKAIDMNPTSGSFRNLCGSAVAYGLIEGGAYASEISASTIARRLFREEEEGQAEAATREAVLTPRVINSFLTKYNGSPLPREDIARNVLIGMGVPESRSSSVYDLIIEDAESVGMLETIKDKRFVSMGPSRQPKEEMLSALEDLQEPDDKDNESSGTLPQGSPAPKDVPSVSDNRRVFVAHGKNKGLIDTIKKLLGFSELVAVVSVERQSVAKPVPDKVMGEMRPCGAGIIHVDQEETFTDSEGKSRTVINGNVLIEIGAAMALYGRRFILLVREGVELPSNLQGLYEVRYQGETLDSDATIRLLEAINDIKNHPIPDRY